MNHSELHPPSATGMNQPNVPLRVSRREMLRTIGIALPLLVSPTIFAAESTSDWDDQSMQKAAFKLMCWLEANFNARAEALKSHSQKPFDLGYDYLAPTEDRGRIRNRKSFEEGRLPRRAAEEHMTKCLAEFERVRVSLAAAECEAAKTWQPISDNLIVRNGRVYDMSITAGRLTVVLDGSRSMTPYLERLRAEIRKDFPDAYIVEVNGCHLDRRDEVPWFFTAPISGVNPFTPDRHIPRVPTGEERPYSVFTGWTRSLPSALTAMTDLMHADAIYWFCDFDDKHDDEVIKEIGRKILARKTKLYVHTVDERPPAMVSLLAEKSGGAVVRKRI